ncbi:MAG TPA: hypothetical protein VI122_10210 [Thermoleophilaceae bacterium]
MTGRAQAEGPPPASRVADVGRAVSAGQGVLRALVAGTATAYGWSVGACGLGASRSLRSGSD